MYKLKESLIDAILLASKNSFPNEFFGLLGSKNKNNIIDELIIIPAETGNQAAIIFSDYKPIDFRIIGSVHSHPSYSNYPSIDDLQNFYKLGKVHLIVCYPFSKSNIKLFNSAGTELIFMVVK